MVLISAPSPFSQARTNAVARDADVYFHPPVSKYSLLEFSAIDEIVEVGYQYARRMIQQLQTTESFVKMMAGAGSHQPG